MKRRSFHFVVALMGLAANVASALNAPITISPSEIERLREKVLSRKEPNSAVLLLPKSFQQKGRFRWLAAHGSHSSHSSHSSHVSHSSGTTIPGYTTPTLPTSSISGFSATTINGYQEENTIFYLPTATTIYSHLTYIVYLQPSHGEVVVSSTGAIEYIPNAGFLGTDSFSLIAGNGAIYSSPVIFTVTISERKRWFIP
jgi:hypothetical protein